MKRMLYVIVILLKSFMMLLKIIMREEYMLVGSCNNIKFPLYVLKVLKLYLFCLPMLVDSCSYKLCVHIIPRHRKWDRFKCAIHILHDALFMFQFLSLR